MPAHDGPGARGRVLERKGAGAALVAGLVWIMNDLGFGGETWLAWLSWGVTMFAGITMVTNVPFYSFKDINLKKSVPFWAVLVIVGALTVIATKPAVVLFLLVVAYSVSGYVQWVLRGRPGRIV